MLTRYLGQLPTSAEAVELPSETSPFTPHLIEAILYAAEASEVLSFALLSRAWHAAATSELLWQHLCHRDLPHLPLREPVLSYRSLYFQESVRKRLSPYGLWVTGDTLVWGRVPWAWRPIPIEPADLSFVLPLTGRIVNQSQSP